MPIGIFMRDPQKWRALLILPLLFFPSILSLFFVSLVVMSHCGGFISSAASCSVHTLAWNAMQMTKGRHESVFIIMQFLIQARPFENCCFIFLFMMKTSPKPDQQLETLKTRKMDTMNSHYCALKFVYLFIFILEFRRRWFCFALLDILMFEHGHCYGQSVTGTEVQKLNTTRVQIG